MKVLLQRMDVLGFGAEAGHLRSSLQKGRLQVSDKGNDIYNLIMSFNYTVALSTWALAGNSAGGMTDGTRNPGVNLRNGFPGTGGHNSSGSEKS